MTPRPTNPSVVVTCEHGGNAVPAPFRKLFEGHGRLLDSHRGWDPGTLALARTLSRRLGAGLVESTTTRLLVDLNRSPHNPRVFSTISRGLPRPQRLDVLDRYHRPHWSAVRTRIDQGGQDGRPVLHLAIHSFTPILDGVVRRPQISLLYDPARSRERRFAADWMRAFGEVEPEVKLGRNDPYRGNQDGLTTAMRKEYPEERYLGVEIEVNQALLGRGARFPDWVTDALARATAGVLASS